MQHVVQNYRATHWFCVVANIFPFAYLFVAASHQTRLDAWSKARRPIKVGIKKRGRLGTSRDSNPASLCCSSAHLVAMWASWGKQFHEPKCGSGHVCRVMAWTRQQGLVPYIGFEKVRKPCSERSSNKSLFFFFFFLLDLAVLCKEYILLPTSNRQHHFLNCS